MNKFKNYRLQSVCRVQLLLFFVAFLFISTESLAQTWSLQQCIDTALVYNKNLAINKGDLIASYEKQKETKANLLPKLNFTADYKYFSDLPYQLMPQSTFGGPDGLYKEVQMGVPHNIGLNIQITLPLYNSQILGAIKSAKIGSELNTLKYKKAQEEIVFEITNLYYNAQILSEQLKFIEKNIINTSKLLDNLKLLYAEKMIKKSDVKKVELQIAQLNTQYKLINSTLIQVIDALKFTIGLPLDKQVDIDKNISPKTPINYPNSENTDIELIAIKSNFLLSELNTLKKSYLPTLSAYGSYSQNGFGYSREPNDFLNFYPSNFVGIQLTARLFNGTTTQKKINQKKIEIQNNNLQFSIANDQNHLLLENAFRKREIALLTVTNVEEQITLATSIYQEMILRLKEGTANLSDILMADNTVRETQQTYLNAVVEYLKTDLELKKLSGNILSKN